MTFQLVYNHGFNWHWRIYDAVWAGHAHITGANMTVEVLLGLRCNRRNDCSEDSNTDVIHCGRLLYRSDVIHNCNHTLSVSDRRRKVRQRTFTVHCACETWCYNRNCRTGIAILSVVCYGTMQLRNVEGAYCIYCNERSGQPIEVTEKFANVFCRTVNVNVSRW